MRPAEGVAHDPPPIIVFSEMTTAATCEIVPSAPGRFSQSDRRNDFEQPGNDPSGALPNRVPLGRQALKSKFALALLTRAE
jgi:hypothetical protein